MNISRVGVDIAKSVFHVHAVDRHGQLQLRGKYPRGKWLDALSKRVPVGTEIGMEACASSHHWARELQALGYRVKLIAAQFVSPTSRATRTTVSMPKPSVKPWTGRTCASLRSRLATSRMSRRHIGFVKSWFVSGRPRPTRSVD